MSAEPQPQEPEALGRLGEEIERLLAVDYAGAQARGMLTDSAYFDGLRALCLGFRKHQAAGEARRNGKGLVDAIDFGWRVYEAQNERLKAAPPQMLRAEALDCWMVWRNRRRR